MRAYWLQTKEQGRTRFIRREVLGSVLFWLVLMPVLDLFGTQSSPWRFTALVNFIILPIFVLGGYLEGRWRWADLEKKYPDDSLPPWE